MTSQTTASEREESRRKRRSNDTNIATRDADSSDDGLDTGASRDMSTTRRDVSDPAAGGESLPTDRQPSSRAARLQQAQGNRAVARAAAAARDRLDGSESREGNGSLEDAPGGAPPERSDGSTTTKETAATLSSSSGHLSGPSTSVRTKPTPDISPTDAGRATSREPVEAGSSPPDTAAPRGVEQDTETDQQGERQPATRSGANAANPSPSREGSTPTRALGGPDGLVAQPKLEGDQSNDKYEREADTVAKAVAAGRSASAVSALRSSRRNGDTPDQTGEDGAERVQPRTDDTGGNPSRGPSNGAESIGRPGSGRSLPDGVRRLIEPTLGTNLGEVQVHTGTRAARATSSVGARALTHRNHIFVGGGESPHDVRLMAHEATHVVQQGATSQASRTTSSTPDVQPLLGQSALEKLNDYAEYIPGWTLLTVLVGYNPLLGEQVEPTPENFLEGLIGLIPGAKLVLDALRRFEVVEKASQVLRETISEFNLNPERLKQTLENAWNDLDTLDLIVSMGESAREVIEKHFVPLKDDAVAFARSLVDRLIGVAKEAAIDVAERLLLDTTAWNLLTKLMGKDPLRDEEVEAKPPGILADTLRLIGAEQHLEKMREEGTFEETAAWFGEQIGRFKELIGRLEELVETAWEALTPKEIGNLWSNLESLASDVGEFLADVVDFAEDVASEVLSRIKDALLSRLDGFAKENVPGFHLLTVIIEKNPFTGENVARTAEALIGGFVRLLPNGHAIYQELADSGVIAEAGARIDAAVEQLGIGWEMIVNLFQGVWDSLSIEDLLDPVGAFQRVVEEFRGPISRIVRFVTTVLREIFHVAVAAMNFPTDLVGSIISNVMGAIDAVKRDPIGFVTNMLEAVKLGFQNFFGNILTYLAGGLTDWLFRGLRDAGIEPPADFSLGSVLEFVLEIVGVTTDRIWEGIAERIGEENVERIRTAMDALTGIWEFVRDVQRQGIGAIWEYVTSQIRGLWDTVTEMAQEWIMERVINRAIRWLVGLLDPSGVTAVINSFQAFFNAVQSAAEYLRDILSIVNDYVSTIAAVAQGQLEAGAQKLEQGLVNAIPVAIGFLANQFGLGNIGQKIEEIVGGIRETVDQAIEWLLDKAEAGVEKVLSAIGFGGEEQKTTGAEEAADESEVEGERWWELSAPFDRVGESHTLAFAGEAKQAELVVRSAERPLRGWITTVSKELQDAADTISSGKYTYYSNQIDRIARKAEDVREEKSKWVRESAGSREVREPETKSMSKGAGKRIRELYLDILRLMNTLDFREGVDVRPDSQVASYTQWDTEAGKMGRALEARPLSVNPGEFSGFSASGSASQLWRIVNQIRPNTYVQAHLLNHHLHGPFEEWNMVPLPSKDNTLMASKIEAPMKRKVLSENEVISYEIEFHFGTHDSTYLHDYERMLPTSFSATATLMELGDVDELTEQTVRNPSNWTEKSGSTFVNESFKVRMPTEPPGGVTFLRLSLSDPDFVEAAVETMAIRLPIGEDLAARILAEKPSNEDELRAIPYVGEKRFEPLREAIKNDEVIVYTGSTVVEELDG